MGLQSKTAVTPRQNLTRIDPEPRPSQIQSPVEEHRVIAHVHMPIGIDVFGQDRDLRIVERIDVSRNVGCLDHGLRLFPASRAKTGFRTNATDTGLAILVVPTRPPLFRLRGKCSYQFPPGGRLTALSAGCQTHTFSYHHHPPVAQTKSRRTLAHDFLA